MHTKHFEETKPIFESLALTYISTGSEISSSESPYGESNPIHNTSEVQTEVEKYLKSKDIHALLNSIVEKILTEKPNYPNSFAVSFLCSEFLDACRPALDRILPKFGKKGWITTHSSTAKDPHLTSSKYSDKSKRDKYDESESDDDELDGTNEATKENNSAAVAVPKQPLVNKARALIRRPAVSAESFDPNKLKEILSQLTIVPKSPEFISVLRKTLTRSPMLRALDVEQKEAIVRAFAGPNIYTDEQDVIVQGEIGDSFYVLEEGLVDVYIQKKGSAEEVRVHTYKPGDAFGQLALLYNAPRAATCRARGSAKLWVLDRVTFKVIVVSAAIQRREKTKSLLRQVAVLAPLSDLEMLTLADSFAEETYADGYTVCKQGEDGNDFYLIKEGLALCFQDDDETGEETLVATLSKGQFFGEMALLASKPRHATVIAKGALRVQAIDRETFIRLFGPMEDILKRNSG
eukprot:gene28185-37087_t